MNTYDENSYTIEFENVCKSFDIYHEKTNSALDHLFKSLNRNNYEKLNVLDNISFKIRKGEVFGIIGKNGAGKSTILKLIARVMSPDSGIIRTKGLILPLIELGLGFNPELTAQHNIVIYGAILGIPKKIITSKIKQILEYAELEKFADTKIKNFSSGMHSRLAFSTAIQVDPDILLIDEVLSVGDIEFQKKSFDSFLDFKKRMKTIIYVSQNLDSIKTLCDNALLLHNGTIQQIGNPSEVVEKYINLASN